MEGFWGMQGGRRDGTMLIELDNSMPAMQI